MFCLILSSFNGTSVRLDEYSISRIFSCPGVARSEAEGEGTKIFDFDRVGSGELAASSSAAHALKGKNPQITNQKRQATAKEAEKQPLLDTPDAYPDFFTAICVNS
jgi:hypothetical protein